MNSEPERNADDILHNPPGTGHVHGSYGKEIVWGGVILVNCAVVNDERVLTNCLTVVKLAL